MPYAIILVVIAAIAQTWLYPWLSLLGSQIPLVVILIALLARRQQAQLFRLGLAAGLALDITQVGPLGVWTVYYGLSSLLLQQLLANPRPAWWLTVVWATLSATLAIPYGQLITQQVHLESWPALIIATALLVAVIVVIPNWLRTRTKI